MGRQKLSDKKSKKKSFEITFQKISNRCQREAEILP
jgi:hypothetical protein